MTKQTKPRPVGRPALPKGEAKGKIVPVRFREEDIKRLEAAARVSKQTVSEWVRSVVSAALLPGLAEANQVNGARSKEARQIRRELRAVGHKGGLRGKG